MRDRPEWQPTKIKYRSGTFRVNPAGVAPGSLYITMEAFRILDKKKKYLHGHLLDLGCGDVPYYEWYREHVDRITCVDWPSTTHNKRHVDILTNLNESLPLKANCVDCILLVSVLEHICEPKTVLREAQRVLVDGG